MKLIRVNSKKRTKKRFSANCEVLPQLIKVKLPGEQQEKVPSPPESSRRKLWIICGVAIIAVLIISLGIGLGRNSNEEIKGQEAYQDGLPNYLGRHRVITRDTWGGRKPLYKRVLKHPTTYVLISHTASSYCTSIELCSKKVAAIQSQHVAELTSPDIGYNFLIGGDENIYVGRGWDNINLHMEDSIGISFIGNFIYDRVTPGMIEATHMLLELGVKEHKLAENYTLLSHNQTGNTLSPGPNVYNVIKFWDHFSPEDVPIVPGKTGVHIEKVIEPNKKEK